jgi:hypothetical protein
VSDPSPLLGRAGIEEAFRRLGDRLARRGVVADLYVFGGAAMALAYDSRRATRDVDALFKPHGIVVEEALAVAAELGLPRWWLNEQASSYVAPGGDSAASRVFDHPGLRVFAASPEHLLAMKALAARPRDAEDIRQLAQVLGLHTVDEVLASVREIFPEEEPPRLGAGTGPPERARCLTTRSRRRRASAGRRRVSRTPLRDVRSSGSTRPPQQRASHRPRGSNPPFSDQSSVVRSMVTLTGSVTVIFPECTPADAYVPVVGSSR